MKNLHLLTRTLLIGLAFVAPFGLSALDAQGPVYATLAEALDAEFLDAPVIGDGRISGHVHTHFPRTDQEGEPLAGFEVIVRPVFRQRDVDGPLVDRVRSLIQTERFRSARTRTVTTDASGYYEFTDLPTDTQYQLLFPRSSYYNIDFEDRTQRRGVPTGSVVELRAKEPPLGSTREIPVLVTWRGEPVTGAPRITVETQNRISSLQRRMFTGETCRAPEGTHRVWAEYRDLRSAPVELTVTEDGPVGIELVLQPRSVLVGWLHSDEVDIVPRLWLVPRDALRLGDTPERGIGSMLGLDQYRGFRWLDVAPGSYDIALQRQDRVAEIWPVDVTPGFNFALLEPGSPADRLEVRTVFAEEPPAEVEYRYEVVLTGDNPVHGSETAGRDRSQTGDASFLPHTPRFRSVWSGEEPGTIRLHVVAEGVGTEVVELRPGQPSVTVEFQPVAQVAIDVPGYLQSELVGRLTVVLTPEGDEKNPVSASPNWLGQFPAVRVQPGRYTARVEVAEREWVPGRRTKPRQIEVPVRLKPGENAVSLPLPD